MQAVTTIGLDIAKSVFQVHGVDAQGNVVVRRQLRRRQVLPFFKKLPSCLVGVEACATSHHWSRELQALGHTVRLMPPVYVKPYLKRQKNDAADAEAICEAVTRPNMRFVATKTSEQQSCLMLHRTRHLFIRQQTAVINAIRAHLAEFGIVAPVGRNGVEELLDVVADPGRQAAGWGWWKQNSAAARNAGSIPSAAIDICAACSRWRARRDPLCDPWHQARPWLTSLLRRPTKVLPSRSPTRSRAWPGP